MIRGVCEGSKLYLVGAGTVLGCMGLAQGGEAFLVAALTAVLVILMTSRGGIPLRLASVLVPAIIVYAIWAGPLMINYFRHGGFFDMSRSSLDFPLWSAIASWGIILPFGVYGLVRVLPQTRMKKEMTVLEAFLLSALIGLIGSVVIEAALGEGFGPLSRRHRYWPILCLAVALFAAVGATDSFRETATATTTNTSVLVGRCDRSAGYPIAPLGEPCLSRGGRVTGSHNGILGE